MSVSLSSPQRLEGWLGQRGWEYILCLKENMFKDHFANPPLCEISTLQYTIICLSPTVLTVVNFRKPSPSEMFLTKKRRLKTNQNIVLVFTFLFLHKKKKKTTTISRP